MNRDWENFGEEIKRKVQNAIEYGDYGELNQTISNTVNRAMETVSQGVKNVTKASRSVQLPIKTPSKAGAVAAMALGYSSGVFLSMIFLGVLLLGGLGTAGIFGLFTAGALGAGIWGTEKLSRINRFKAYVKTIGKREYCNISELAGKIGRSDKKVLKDLEYMIQNRWFAQGHFDAGKTCLIATDRMYQQYRQLEQRKLAEQQEAEREKMKEMEREEKDASSEIQGVIQKGEAYLEKIRLCNDEIPGEEISAKISRIELLVENIFERVEQNPKSVSDIRKLMEYYLPATVKLLEAYAQMNAQPVGGENIRTAKKEIEATLDTLNTAFEKLLDDLFRETAWDVSSDISVLNTMLAQEGLKDDGLKNRK